MPAESLAGGQSLPDRAARRAPATPGGLGEIDGGLIGELIVYGTPAAPTAAAVVVYRVILFWLPVLVAAVAFIRSDED